MILRLLLALAILFTLNACGDNTPPPEAVEETETVQPDALAPPKEAVFMVDKSLVAHMHLHAEQLYKLREALDKGDLWEAMTPAFWLSRHDTVEGFPDEWQQYAKEMRVASFAVESATDLETARQAAQRIVDSCNGCHTTAGIEVEPIQ